MTTSTAWSARPPGKIPTREVFTRREWQTRQTHKTPERVQQFLRTLPYNREVDGETCYSFRRVIRENRAHCLEGALCAEAIVEQHGCPAVIKYIECYS